MTSHFGLINDICGRYIRDFIQDFSSGWNMFNYRDIIVCASTPTVGGSGGMPPRNFTTSEVASGDFSPGLLAHTIMKKFVGKANY
jgi:hypothetical protein